MQGLALTPPTPSGDQAPSDPAPWAWPLAAAFVLLGVACRALLYFLNYPLFRDEASLAHNFYRDYRGLTCELDYLQVAPVFFLWAEKLLVQAFGASELVLRALPFLAGTAGLLLFWRLARAVLPPLEAALAVGLLAVSRWAVTLSAFVKPYSLDLLLAVSALLLAHDYLRHGRRRYLILLAVGAPLAVCTSYAIVFVGGAVSLVLLPAVWRKGGPGDKAWFVAFNVLLVLGFGSHLRLVGHEVYDPAVPAVRDYMDQFWTAGFPRWERGPARVAWWVLHRQVQCLLAYPMNYPGSGVLGLVLCLAGGWAMHRNGKGALLALCALPFALHFVACLLRRYPYGAHQRLEQDLAPGICLLMGCGVVALLRLLARREAARRVALSVTVVALVLVGVGGAIRDVGRPYHDEQAGWTGELVGHLRREVAPGDLILLPHGFRAVEPSVLWYLRQEPFQCVYGGPPDWARLEREGGRVWVLDVQVLERQRTEGPPTAHGVARLVPAVAGTSWGEVGHRRFDGRVPGKTTDWAFSCDVHLLAPCKGWRPKAGIVTGRAG